MLPFTNSLVMAFKALTRSFNVLIREKPVPKFVFSIDKLLFFPPPLQISSVAADCTA